MDALIVVDMQNCFASEGGMIYVKQAKEQVPKIKELIQQYKEIGVPVIYTAVIWDNEKEIPLGLRENMPQILKGWDKHAGLKRGVWGAEIHPELNGLQDYTVEKKSFDAFYNTDLETILRERKIDSVVLLGTTASNCVYATALGAFSRNYRVFAIREGISGFDESSRNAFLDNIKRFLGKII
jgi:nicotinamidase-related amidase